MESKWRVTCLKFGRLWLAGFSITIVVRPDPTKVHDMKQNRNLNCCLRCVWVTHKIHKVMSPHVYVLNQHKINLTMKWNLIGQLKTNLAMRVGGLDCNSHTKIFPSRFPANRYNIYKSLQKNKRSTPCWHFILLPIAAAL